jgi:hypothetical protein
MILLISASQVARITAVSHWHPRSLTASDFVVKPTLMLVVINFSKKAKNVCILKLVCSCPVFES